jgi:hypothetical protein
MKKLFIILFSFISWFANAQDYDFQQLCLDCAEVNGFYCGDDPANWTQYAPNGCVVNNWLNDGWEDCVDATDENGAVPTTTEECGPPEPNGCDTVYVNVPVIEYVYETDTLEIPFYVYETIIQFDTIIETEFITNIVIDTIVDVQFDTIYNTEYITQIVIDTVVEYETVYNTEYITQIVVDTVIEEVEVLVPEYIYVTDTVYAEVLDTLFVDVIEEVEVVVYDTVVETEIEYVEFFTTDTITQFDTIVNTEYIEFFTTDTILQYDTIVNTEYIEIVVVDTILEYIEVINTEYIDCDTGMPCGSSIQEIVDKSSENSVIYNLQGQAVKVREGLYIENGKIYFKK